ncbi:uncharacterized protein LOC118197609 isoform X2 [Stegodyphus dumicola]|uniref:uncharacterized protein LOC118197609 isoform X2 n=1 Tax=Stegodyphus dumicola TaxID=202533 RepID=UPI0015AD112B|nr:uncharacterized protein LOC118197609 isoform X2 [Stegodyphus dumicola]
MGSSFYILFPCLALNFFVSHGYRISFQKYCLGESLPDTLPSLGEKSSGSLIMNSKPENGSWYLPNLNCSVTLTAEEGFRLFLTFSNVSLRNSSMDNLTVIFNNEESDVVLAGQQICSNENCQGLKFESGSFNNLTLKFISANVSVPSNVTGFKAHYTVYDLGVIPVKNTVWGIVVIVIAVISVIVFVPMFCFLATSGTRSIVKSVTVPNHATPLLPTVDCGETSGLLTSSEAVINCWPGTSYERSYSFSYGTAQNLEPSRSEETVQKNRRSSSDAHGSKWNESLYSDS